MVCVKEKTSQDMVTVYQSLPVTGCTGRRSCRLSCDDWASSTARSWALLTSCAPSGSPATSATTPNTAHAFISDFLLFLGLGKVGLVERIALAAGDSRLHMNSLS